MILHSSKVGFARKTASVVLAAAFIVAIAGCSDLPQTASGCTPVAKAGAASRAIDANGKFGENPEAKIPTPTVAKTVQISVPREGKGRLLGTDDIARLQYTIYKGDAATPLFSSGATGTYTADGALQSTIGAKRTIDPIGHNLVCQRVGSRVITVLDATDFFGSAAQATANNLQGTDTLIVITDLTEGFRGRATGILQPLKSGFPSVVTAPDGTPGLTFDLQSPPKTLQSETVRRGSGAKVKQGDTILLQIQGVEWSTPPATDTFVSTWTKHQPTPTIAASITQNAGSILDPGSAKSLIGQTVGSQVIVVVPPKYGYPSGKAPSGYPTGSTLVFVYDILGIE